MPRWCPASFMSSPWQSDSSSVSVRPHHSSTPMHRWGHVAQKKSQNAYDYSPQGPAGRGLPAAQSLPVTPTLFASFGHIALPPPPTRAHPARSQSRAGFKTRVLPMLFCICRTLSKSSLPHLVASQGAFADRLTAPSHPQPHCARLPCAPLRILHLTHHGSGHMLPASPL